jgi:hypothetical protein
MLSTGVTKYPSFCVDTVENRYLAIFGVGMQWGFHICAMPLQRGVSSSDHFSRTEVLEGPIEPIL